MNQDFRVIGRTVPTAGASRPSLAEAPMFERAAAKAACADDEIEEVKIGEHKELGVALIRLLPAQPVDGPKVPIAEREANEEEKKQPPLLSPPSKGGPKRKSVAAAAAASPARKVGKKPTKQTAGAGLGAAAAAASPARGNKSPAKNATQKPTSPSKVPPVTSPRQQQTLQAPVSGQQVVNNKSLHELLEEREDRILTENADKRVREAKQRLRQFVIHTDMEDEVESQRLLNYYAHRFATFFAILSEAVKDKRRLKKDIALQDYVPRESALHTRQDQALIQALQNYNPQAAAKKANKEMAEYRDEWGLSGDTKIFTVLGKYQPLRDQLEERGWVENEWEVEEDSDGEALPPTVSLAFDFLYARKASDVFRIPLAPHQQVNHIFGQKALTTKNGLTHSMKNLIWQHNLDIGRVFPQSFDVTSATSEEFKDFREDFKFGFVVSLLKRALAEPESFVAANYNKILISIVIVERRIRVLSGQLFEQVK